ncbi:MAG: RyR domain-containing protein [Acidobacteriota bacterium]
MKTVIVSGDLLWDYNLAQHPLAQATYRKDPLQRSRLSNRAGGAWYVEDMIRLACSDLDAAICAPLRPANPFGQEAAGIGRAYSLWSLHERNLDSKKKNDRVWRISQFLGCETPDEPQPLPVSDDIPDPDLLVIEDLGLGFRSYDHLWPAALGEQGDPKRILIKTTSPVEGPLWEPLWERLLKKCYRITAKTIEDLEADQMPSPLVDCLHPLIGAPFAGEERFLISIREAIGEKAARYEKAILGRAFFTNSLADRIVVVIPAAVLRAMGANISQALSWDRTIEETVREFQSGNSAHYLRSCRRVIVHFGNAGAASFTRCRPLPDGSEPLFDRLHFERFLYHPDSLEGSWMARRPGRTFGITSILAAAVARHELEPESYPLYIALCHGLAAAAISHEQGGGERDLDTEAANEHIRQMLLPPPEPGAKREDHLIKDFARPEAIYCTAYPSTLLDVTLFKSASEKKNFRSDLLQDITGEGLEYVAAKAMDIVLRGPREVLRAAPEAHYGSYQTADREEIERINSIRSLIISYQENAKDTRPLSIAVFGPPGSGKSFAIKQLASELFGERKAILEFNLSQFTGIENLQDAFHQIVDASVQGQTPLIFWDEFDTAREGRSLGWLKEFLAPMQDARFQTGNLSHLLGKAIFVFAGGAKPDFESFDRSDADGKEGKHFREVKGPDFVSRLRGFVNIKGPNPVTEGGDVAYLIRRAVLLRSILERSFPHLIDDTTRVAAISTSVIKGFLRVEKYLHGARSLESLVNMSGLAHTQFFGPAQLPAESLLRLHVTEDFLRLVEEGQLEASVIEAIARDLHERWRRKRLSQGWKPGSPRDDYLKVHPMLRPYGELTEAEKEKNRLPARLTQAKLDDVSYRIARREEDDQSGPPRFTKEEHDKLLRIEHDIWLREYLINGYEWAEETRDHVRLHRDIAPFEKVPDEDQALDRENVAAIPVTLWENGYTLVRKSCSTGGDKPFE